MRASDSKHARAAGCALEPPRAALRIGVVGHTKLKREEETRIVVEQALRHIVATGRRTFEEGAALYAPGEPTFGLVSGLAPGADQLVAKVGWELDDITSQTFVLANDREAYGTRPGSDPKKVAEYLDAEDPLSAVRLIELDLPVEHKDPWGSDLTALRVTVDHADVLIAIWDGRHEAERSGRRPSCTLAAIELAEQQDIPVIWIDADDPAQSKAAARAKEPKLPGPWAHRVSSPFVGNAAYPQPDGAAPTLEELLRPALCPFTHPPAAYDPKPVRPLFRGALWRMFASWARRAALRELGGDPARRQPPAKNDRVTGSLAGWDHWYEPADQCANRYAELYRGAFTGTFVLGAFAVLFAVLAYLVKSAYEEWIGFFWIGMGLTAVEFGCVLGILELFRRSNRGEWHVKAIDFRLLAELLRHARWLGVVAGAIPRPRPPLHRSADDEPRHWALWYFHAVARQFSFGKPLHEPCEMRFDEEYVAAARAHLLHGWIRNQQEWHRVGSKCQQIMANWLHRFGFYAFVAVLAACGTSLLVLPIFLCVDWPPEGVVKCLLLIAVACVPAFAAAAHGISTQAELEQLGETYGRMHRALTGVVTNIEQLPKTVTVRELRQIANQAAGVMINELDDWHAIHGSHEVPLV